MHEQIQRYTPAQIPVIFAVWVLVLAALAGCNPAGERPSIYETLVQTDSLITTGQETLLEAINIGVVDTASEDYAKVHTGLSQANEAMDAAWASYFKGDHDNASGMRVIALEVYSAIRPTLYRLAGEAE